MKKSYQQRKENRERVTNYICLVIMMTIGLYFLSLAVQDIHLLSHWDGIGIQTYTGEYRLEVITNLRNTMYRFILCNGDIVDVPSEYIDGSAWESRYEHNDYELTFEYSNYKRPIQNSHSGIAIVSTTDETIYLDELLMKTVFRRGVRIYFTLGASTMTLSVLWGVLMFGCKNTRRH